MNQQHFFFEMSIIYNNKYVSILADKPISQCKSGGNSMLGESPVFISQ